MFSASVDVGFVLALPFHHGDLEPDFVEVSRRGGGGEREARGIVERRTQGGKMLLMLAGDWRASALRGEEAGRFREVAGVLRSYGRSAFAVDNLTIDSRVAKFAID